MQVAQDVLLARMRELDHHPAVWPGSSTGNRVRAWCTQCWEKGEVSRTESGDLPSHALSGEATSSPCASRRASVIA
jgi:hypothetical protein